jgi:hypothetical protein
MIALGAGKWLTRVTDPADKKRKNSRINSGFILDNECVAEGY